MKLTVLLISLILLISLTSAQVFDYTWPTVYTIDVLELPTVPNFLDDYSAPGQVEWNQQVYWQLNSLEDLIEEIRPYHQERIYFDPIREIEAPTHNNHSGTPESYWFQIERDKKEVLFDF